jgi:hypothetical protein
MTIFQTRRHLIAVGLILLVAALLRLWLIQSGGVSFDSDEAVVGLMARHINQGQPIPTFFYGQAYMGSLDALLVAGGFQVLGESVQTIRMTQMVLYLLALVTAYPLTYAVTRRHRIAAVTLLLLAIPTANGALYTTLTLGGYNEIVLLGNLILLLGWQVTVMGRREAWRWGLLGLAAGVGWWSNGAIITACLAVGLIGLRYFSVRHWRGYALAAAGFLIGSSPWWLYNVQHDWAALDFIIEGYQLAPGVDPISPGETVIALLALGLPALYGLRYPWEAGFSVTLSVAVGAGVYLVLVTDMIAGAKSTLFQRNVGAQLAAPGRGVLQYAPTTTPKWAYQWVWLIFGLFAVVFILSSFADATGRYLMPIWVPAAIGVALGLDRLRRAGRIVPALALGALLVMQAGSVIRAAQTDTGLTPQLVERLRAPAADDDALLNFLAAHDYTRGYASYWTSYRVIFRSHETVILDTALPHDERGLSDNNSRYPPYADQVAASERVVWITQNFPELDALIVSRLTEAQITYQTRAIGRYRVYYDFSRRVGPTDLDLSDPF